MEEMTFKTRFEKIAWYEKQMGWGPLTEEERKAIDDAVRTVTNLD